VIRIAQEADREVLRQVALLLERENARLHARIGELITEIATLKGTGRDAIQQDLETLRQQLAQRTHALFGDASEQRPRAVTRPSPTTPRRGHGPTPQPTLPVVDHLVTLDEAARTCAACGGHLQPMTGQYEDAEEITVVARQFVVTRHRRQKYRCRCNGQVATAPAPVKLYEGARYSPAFAIEVAIAKYLDHLPLERQARIMGREGLAVTSQTLWDQIERLARLLQPTYEAIHDVVLTAPVIGADETHWRVMGQPDTSKRWWAWCLTSPDAAIYTILASRSRAAATTILRDYGGIVIADGYTAYDALARGDPGFRVAHCWAHVRRKFVEVTDFFPEPCRVVLDQIGTLYHVEHDAQTTAVATRAPLVDVRRDLRAARSRVVVEAIRDWALDLPVLGQSGLGKAIAYMLGLWSGLTQFLEDPRIPLDNNAVERALRGPVVGRKNFYGARSRRGAQVAALFYTLVETAKLRHAEPKAYLRQAVTAALALPGAVTLPASTHAA
jgi:transposase